MRKKERSVNEWTCKTGKTGKSGLLAKMIKKQTPKSDSGWTIEQRLVSKWAKGAANDKRNEPVLVNDQGKAVVEQLRRKVLVNGRSSKTTRLNAGTRRLRERARNRLSDQAKLNEHKCATYWAQVTQQKCATWSSVHEPAEMRNLIESIITRKLCDLVVRKWTSRTAWPDQAKTNQQKCIWPS